MTTQKRSRIVVLSGLSGSGKTTASKALEDAGYFCIDNLPLALVPRLIDLAEAQHGALDRLALVIDAREPGQLTGLAETLQNLAGEASSLYVIFLTADEETLVRRYSETRRRHPFSPGDVREGIRKESALLEPIRNAAHIVLDSSRLSIYELRAEVLAVVGESATPRETGVAVMSFGFKHGIPGEADLVFDVRFLPNPFYQPHLRELVGLDPAVRDYVLSQPDAAPFLERVADLLRFLLPRYEKAGKTIVTVAIGCTGGQHRSVALSHALVDRLTRDGLHVTARHRDARFNRAEPIPAQDPEEEIE